MLRFLVALLLLKALAAQTPSPVIFDGQELWLMRAPIGSLPPGDRAADVQANLLHAAQDTRVPLEAARSVEGTSDVLMLLGRYLLFAVTEEDARLEGKSRGDLFAERRTIALNAIQRYRQQRSATALLRSAGIAIAILGLAFVALLLVRATYRRAIRWLAAAFVKVTPGGRLGTIYTMFRNSLRIALLFAVRAVFLSLAAVVLLTALSSILGLFPATRQVSSAVFRTALETGGNFVRSMLAYLPNLVVLAIVWALTFVLIRVSKAISQAIAGGTLVFEGFHRDWAAPTHDLVRILLILFGLVVAFPYLPGGDTPALRGASIFIGVLVSLGSGSAMGNVIAGVILTYMRPYRVGDRVQIGDTIGDVVEKSLLVTRVRTIKNVDVIVPNSAILNGHVLNFSTEAQNNGLILHVTITIGYDAPWRKVHELLIQAALNTDLILPDPKPFVLQTSLNDYHVSYEINAYTRNANAMAEIYSHLYANIQEEFNRGGIEIMSPAFHALRDGNTVTIPEQNRPADYRPASFRVNTPS